MKLRELLELQNQSCINNVITIHEGETCHMFINEDDYENFDLDKFGDAEVVRFRAEAVLDGYILNGASKVLPYLSITCMLDESPKQNMQETVEEFFGYLDESLKTSQPASRERERQ